MTPPAFFAVAYAINPWMDVTAQSTSKSRKHSGSTSTRPIFG